MVVLRRPLAPLLAVLAFASGNAHAQGFGIQRQERKRDTAAAAGAAPAPPAPVRYVLTISGGISLGAYEAGFNWTLLRYLKKHRPASTSAGSALVPLELVAATGASAGNINAFLTAVGWCQTSAFDDRETPTDNLFWRAWVPIGLEKLFPGPGGKYQDDDGLFARSAFRDIESELGDATRVAGRFRENCTLPIGITVTRNRLGNIVIKDTAEAGSGLQVATQRFVVTLDARTSQAGLEFHERSRRCDDAAVGQYLHLPGDRKKAIPVETVMGLVEASSAFPLAFGAKTLKHCFRGGKRDPQCAVDPEVTGSETFFDGGVFDNVPLGLGVSLALPPPSCDSDGSRGDVEFLYVDPERRRRGAAGGELAMPDPALDSRRGLSSTFQFLENFVLVSRQYELQTAARYVFDRLFTQELRNARSTEEKLKIATGEEKPSHVARLRLSSRFYPLVGSYLRAFGAFFAESFRQYDFYVGLYDALFGFAEAYCRSAPDVSSAAAEQARCIAGQVVDLERQLHISGTGSEAAHFVVHELLRREIETWFHDSPAGATVLASMTAIDPAAPGPGASAEMTGQIKVMAALLQTQGEVDRNEEVARAAQNKSTMEKFERENTFISFVNRFHSHLGDLRADGVKQQFTPTERRFVEDPDAEMRVTLADAAERQAEIEEKENYQLGTRAMAVTQMVLHSEPFRPSKGLDLDPSSIPDRRLTIGRAVARVLPYSVSGDLLNGGTNIEYRPGYWFAERAGIGVPFSPVVWQSGQGGRMLAAVGLAALIHFDTVAIPELQLGARFTQSWADLAGGRVNEIHPGCELAAYLLAGKLRLSVGVDDFAQVTTRHAWSIKLGLGDLNGLFYWAIRFISG